MTWHTVEYLINMQKLEFMKYMKIDIYISQKQKRSLNKYLFVQA